MTSERTEWNSLLFSNVQNLFYSFAAMPLKARAMVEARLQEEEEGEHGGAGVGCVQVTGDEGEED